MDMKKKLARLRAQAGPMADDRLAITDGREPIADGRLAITDGREPIADDRFPIADGREPIADDRASTAGADKPFGRASAIKSRLLALANRQAKPKGKRVQGGGGLLGAVRMTARGEVHAVGEALDPDHAQGGARLRRGLVATGELVAKLALDARLSGIDFSRALYIDTETTGLSGGAGTLPFLIGMCWFDGTSVQVEQLVLRKPGEEAPMLEVLGERIAAAPCIVSYNGKSFDWPLLRTRFVLNRMKVPEPAAHVDLLHCARRVFKRRLTNVQLTELEREVLKLARVDDVGGADIPAIYMEFLRGRDGSCLNPILLHNRHDLVSLVALLGVLVDKLESASSDDDLRDQLALAELSVRAGDGERAHAFAITAASGDAHVSAAALVLMARVHKRKGEFASAVAALEKALTRVDAEMAPTVCLELAKLYERRLRDPARALHYANQATVAEPEHLNERRIKRLALRASRMTLPLPVDFD